MNIRTKKLLESIDKNINSFKIPDEKIILEGTNTEENSENILFERNEKNNNKTQEIFDELDKITFNKE